MSGSGSGAGGEGGEEEQTIETLKKIALDESKLHSERERAIDALAVFGEKALPALAEIADRADFYSLRNRAMELLREIKEGKR